MEKMGYSEEQNSFSLRKIVVWTFIKINWFVNISNKDTKKNV